MFRDRRSMWTAPGGDVDGTGDECGRQPGESFMSGDLHGGCRRPMWKGPESDLRYRPLTPGSPGCAPAARKTISRLRLAQDLGLRGEVKTRSKTFRLQNQIEVTSALVQCLGGPTQAWMLFPYEYVLERLKTGGLMEMDGACGLSSLDQSPVVYRPVPATGIVKVLFSVVEPAMRMSAFRRPFFPGTNLTMSVVLLPGANELFAGLTMM